MRSVVIEALHKRIEASLLLQDIRDGWFRGFPFQREMHPLVPAVLLRVARRDAFQLNAEAEPTTVERVAGGERNPVVGPNHLRGAEFLEGAFAIRPGTV